MPPVGRLGLRPCAMILDIHTHHDAPQPHGIISLRFTGSGCELMPDQNYSIGVHPWDSDMELSDGFWEEFEALARMPQIVAIGECGVDVAAKRMPMFRQLNIFRRQVELAERLRKPMVLHDVKAHDIIVGLIRDLRPLQNHVVHGFRGKPQVAEMLLRAGCFISFGALFNPETLRNMPDDRILAETDEAPYTIEHIIERLSEARGKEMKETIERNTVRFLTQTINQQT